jgi:hypothetical protein
MICSLVGDPKTAPTIVSHRVFLKFIPVMSNIQRMDAINTTSRSTATFFQPAHVGFQGRLSYDRLQP